MATRGSRKVAARRKRPAASELVPRKKQGKASKPARETRKAERSLPDPSTAVELISEPEFESEPDPEPAGAAAAKKEGEGGEAVSFVGVLRPSHPAGTHVQLTREQSARFPGGGAVPVTGTVGGTSVQTSLVPMEDGTRCLRVSKDVMEQGGFHHGDAVEVSIALDPAPREVVVPKDFLDALEKSPEARRTFAGYSFSHRKEYVSWIEEARQPETRHRRIDQAVRMLEGHEKLS